MAQMLTPLELPLLTTVAASATGFSNLFAMKLAGFGFPAWRNATELIRYAQPSFFCRQVGLIRPSTGTALSSLGMEVVTAGTVSHPALATSNPMTYSYRTRFATAAGAGSSALVRTVAAHLWRGNSGGAGGFFWYSRCGFSTLVTNQRAFVGLYGTVADIGNVSPDTLVNMIGFGHNTGDTQLQVYSNDGAGTATRTALGTDFALNTTSLYDLFLFCVANTSQVEYLVIHANTLAQASGILTTDLPVSSTFLAPQAWVNNGTTASAAQMEFMTMYWDTFY